jgi:hypothetical protein
MFKFLSIALVLSPLAVLAQVTPVTQCDSYVFQCNWNVYQCGAEMGFPEPCTTPDSCDHGGWPTYRPLPANDCTTLINAVKNANYTAGLAWGKIRCRETHVTHATNGIGVGDTLSSWGCYKTGGPSLIMTSKAAQKTCVKDKSYFTNRDAVLGNDHKCGCGTAGNPANCTGVKAGSTCQPGYICVPTSSTHSKCMINPLADHTCCHSLNHVADDVLPGRCCLGGRADKWKCVPGFENKTTPYTGICNSTDVGVRKSSIMEGNLCLRTPDIVTPGVAKPPPAQGDCMIGLRCDGSKGYGFCKWWDTNTAYKNKCNMKPWTRGCEPGDCQGKANTCWYFVNTIVLDAALSTLICCFYALPP